MTFDLGAGAVIGLMIVCVTLIICTIVSASAADTRYDKHE